MMTQKEIEDQAAQQAAILLTNGSNAAVGTSSAAKTTTPADIINSYYPKQSNASNYAENRPVYTKSDALKQAESILASKESQRPASYVSQYGDTIQTLLDRALNRPSFSYDFNADPLYQQYAEKYQQQGKQASKDAMGQAAALTGGYGNSYAQSVGQQTYQQYLSKLNDVLPELRSAAYQKYQDEGTTLNNNISLLQNQEDSFYNRYRDSVSDYNTELNFLYNAAKDMSEQEYNHYQNDVSAWESDRAYWYQKARDDYAKQLAAAASKSRGRGSGGKGSKSTTYALPTTYSEYVALTNDNTIMTETEWKRHKNSNSSGVAGTNSYADYLKAMIAKHN